MQMHYDRMNLAAKKNAIIKDLNLQYKEMFDAEFPVSRLKKLTIDQLKDALVICDELSQAEYNIRTSSFYGESDIILRNRIQQKLRDLIMNNGNHKLSCQSCKHLAPWNDKCDTCINYKNHEL